MVVGEERDSHSQNVPRGVGRQEREGPGFHETEKERMAVIFELEPKRKTAGEMMMKG